MRKLRFLLILLYFVNLTLPANAQQEKFIQLKDGSSLSGQVLGLVNGVYTVRTENLGTIKIEEENILSIANKDAANVQTTNAAAPAMTGSIPSGLTASDMSAQMQMMQQSILSNPAMMADIQAMASDPEIVQLLTDQSFIQQLMSMDLASIENDPRFQKLMGNAKIRAFVEKFKNTKTQ